METSDNRKRLQIACFDYPASEYRMPNPTLNRTTWKPRVTHVDFLLRIWHSVDVLNADLSFSLRAWG